MDIRQAQNQFQEIFDGLRRRNKEDFLYWISKTVGRSAFADPWDSQQPLLQNPGCENGTTTDTTTEPQTQRMQTGDMKLSEIINDLREALPMSGILDTENIIIPKSGMYAELDENHTIPLDAFLYDDFMLEQLCEDGKLNRTFCKDCNSNSTAPLIFISHSMSKKRLQYMFLSLLPDLQGKTVLDIGSRLGNVLYGGYIYSSAQKLIGIEMNSDFCTMQNQMVDKHNLSDKIEVICDDIRNRPDIIRDADVIIIHSVADFFLAHDEHLGFWKFLYENTKNSEKLLVTTPSIDNALSPFKDGIDIGSWVTLVQNPHLKELEADPDCAELNLYQCR